MTPNLLAVFYLISGVLHLIFVFSFENNLECPIKLDKKNKSKHKDYKEYYDKETQDLVYNFYKKDFDLLGYDYEL